MLSICPPSPTAEKLPGGSGELVLSPRTHGAAGAVTIRPKMRGRLPI